MVQLVKKLPSSKIPIVDDQGHPNVFWYRFFTDLASNVLTGTTTIGFLASTGIVGIARTFTAGSSKITVTNGDGQSGNPVIDATESAFTLDNLGGTLSLTKGGTGSTTASGVRTAIGLGTIATQNSNSISVTGGSLSGVSLASPSIITPTITTPAITGGTLTSGTITSTPISGSTVSCTSLTN